MFVDLIVMLVMAATIVLMVLWVPLLDVICPPCRRFLERQTKSREYPQSEVPSDSVRNGC
jgi:hypothetical protein